MERKLEFRKRLNEIHRSNVRNAAVTVKSDEVEITEEWRISADSCTPESPAADLRDFLQTSMNVSVAFAKGTKTLELRRGDKSVIELDVKEDRIILKGNIRKGVHYLEEQMEDAGGPYLKQGTCSIKLRFSPRMIHSGFDLDVFPDAHLNAIAHAGYDAILVFVRGPGQASRISLDFDDLIDRAEKYDLKVYFYSYLSCYKHPDDPDAEEFFDKNFGIMFQLHPKAAGLILVGESCVFPSKDPRLAEGGKLQTAGYFPVCDYPQWLNAVKRAVRKYNPEADIVFWTYNFGRSPVDDRLELIRNLPKDVSLEVTFEMYELVKCEKHTAMVPDYTITYPGPCYAFTSEAEAIHERGIPLYAMVNTSGVTWDCGVAPYIPAMQQWGKRFRRIVEANEKWNLTGLMEGHHNGWFPGPVQECAKRYFRCPELGFEDAMRKTAVHFYGEKAADPVIRGWQFWSDAVNSYLPGFDDQAGPLRVGPAYPLLFEPIQYPYEDSKSNVPDFSVITTVPYKPEQLTGPSYAGIRLHEDIRVMTGALALWEKGNDIMRQALELVPDRLKAEAVRQIGVGFFFGHALRTMVNTKRWYILNQKLKVEADRAAANAILDEMSSILKDEIANAEETIPLTENDSRLGWEPRMQYVGHAENIRWKIGQCRRVLDYIIPAYRISVNL